MIIEDPRKDETKEKRDLSASIEFFREKSKYFGESCIKQAEKVVKALDTIEITPEGKIACDVNTLTRMLDSARISCFCQGMSYAYARIVSADFAKYIADEFDGARKQGIAFDHALDRMGVKSSYSLYADEYIYGDLRCSKRGPLTVEELKEKSKETKESAVVDNASFLEVFKLAKLNEWSNKQVECDINLFTNLLDYAMLSGFQDGMSNGCAIAVSEEFRETMREGVEVVHEQVSVLDDLRTRVGEEKHLWENDDKDVFGIFKEQGPVARITHWFELGAVVKNCDCLCKKAKKQIAVEAIIASVLGAGNITVGVMQGNMCLVGLGSLCFGVSLGFIVGDIGKIKMMKGVKKITKREMDQIIDNKKLAKWIKESDENEGVSKEIKESLLEYLSKLDENQDEAEM